MKNQGIPWGAITKDLLTRYSAPVPRYTSYPTAPEWKTNFQAADYEQLLKEADQQKSESFSIYIHIPFCKERCLYCGCASWLVRGPDDSKNYLDSLEREVARVAELLPHRRRVSQIHLGGGTPTTLSSAELERLHGIIADHFEIQEHAELAIEVNPAVTSPAQIELLSSLGFNRISFGVQDFNREVQEAVSRIQPRSVTEELFEKARSSGFEGINMDLMYGLPRQNPDNWEETLETAIAMGPDRLAVFGYAHVPWMRPHQKQLNEKELPDTDLRFYMFQRAHDRLVESGYVYVGMDHFAKPEDELSRALDERRLWRNFQGYTVRQACDLLGFGVTAIGEVGGSFAQNNAELDAYMKTVAGEGLATYRGFLTSNDDKLRRHIITQLMCNLFLEIGRVEEEFGLKFWAEFEPEARALETLARDGIVEFDDRSIQVTAKGRIFVRHVGSVFDSFLGKQTHGGPRFSKSV